MKLSRFLELLHDDFLAGELADAKELSRAIFKAEALEAKLSAVRAKCEERSVGSGDGYAAILAILGEQT